MKQPRIADGIRIVEVSDYVFVPVAGAILAAWGADVIKVEHHERGDAMRGLIVQRSRDSARQSPSGVGIVPANRGKRSIGINLSSEEGRKVLYALVKDADVFITNRTNETLRKLGITLDEIRAHNPDIIFARGTAHGSRGPEADRGGFDTADFWSRGGVSASLHVPGAELPPNMPSPGFGDNTSGHHLAGGILGALFHRARTGEALTIEVSLLGSGMWAMRDAIAYSTAAGQSAVQNPHGPNPDPLNDVYRTRDDRCIALHLELKDDRAAKFCEMLGLDDLAPTDLVAAHHDESVASALTHDLANAIKMLTLAEILERAGRYGDAFTPAQDTFEVLTDPQVIANGYLANMTSDPADLMRDVTPPVQFNGVPADLLPAPAFNEHGDEILQALGLSEDEVIALKIAGAVT